MRVACSADRFKASIRIMNLSEASKSLACGASGDGACRSLALAALISALRQEDTAAKPSGNVRSAGSGSVLDNICRVKEREKDEPSRRHMLRARLEDLKI